MSHRGINPNDYEYDGSESAEESVAPVRETGRSGRFHATTALTTAVLAAAGLLGGAAFALTNSGGSLGPATLPMVQAPSTESVANPSTAPVESATPSASASATTDSSASQGAAGGKTIAVPPAAFQDKNGERDFHGSKPAVSTSPVSTATPAVTAPAPSFGGGDGQDSHDGGERHHRTPAPGTTGSPSFNNGNEDD
jgi:hypothetical protein